MQLHFDKPITPKNFSPDFPLPYLTTAPDWLGMTTAQGAGAGRLPSPAPQSQASLSKSAPLLIS